MQSMTCLTPSDQQHVRVFAQRAIVWFRTFDDLPRPAQSEPPHLDTDVRLNIILALHHMSDFRNYVGPFIQVDDRITAFEDAVAEAVYTAIAGQTAGV